MPELITVTLPSGNKGVYRVQPRHMNLLHWNANMNQVAIDLGVQVAHQFEHRWYKPGGWEEITDSEQIAALESCQTT